MEKSFRRLSYRPLRMTRTSLPLLICFCVTYIRAQSDNFCQVARASDEGRDIDRVIAELSSSKTCVIIPTDSSSITSALSKCLSTPGCFQGPYSSFTWSFESEDDEPWTWGGFEAATCKLSDSSGNEVSKDDICGSAGNKIIVHDSHSSEIHNLCESSEFRTTAYFFGKPGSNVGSYTLQLARKNLVKMSNLVLLCETTSDTITTITMPSTPGDTLTFSVPTETFEPRTFTWILQQPDDSDATIKPGRNAAEDPTTLNAVCKVSGYSDPKDVCNSGDIIFTGAVYPDTNSGDPVLATNTSWCNGPVAFSGPLILPYWQQQAVFIYTISSPTSVNIYLECKTFPAIQNCETYGLIIEGTLANKARHVPFYFPLCSSPAFLPFYNPSRINFSVTCSYKDGISTFYGKGPVLLPSRESIPNGFCGNEVYDGEIYTSGFNIVNTKYFPDGACEAYLAGNVELYLFLLNEDDNHEWVMDHTLLIRNFFKGPNLQLYYGRYKPNE